MAWCPEGHELEQGDKFCTSCGGQPYTKCSQGHEMRAKHDEWGATVRTDFCHECGESYPLGYVNPR